MDFFSDIIYKNSFGLFVNDSVLKNYVPNLSVGFISKSNNGYPYYLNNFLKQLNIDKENIVFKCNSFEVLKEMTLNGLIIGLLPRDVANSCNDSLREVTPHYLKGVNKSEHNIMLLSRKNVKLEMKRMLLDSLRKEFKDYINAKGV